MKKSYDYVLFDWDGNIARTLDIWLEACRTVLGNHGIVRTDQEFAASFGAWGRFARDDWKVDIDIVAPEMDAYAAQHLPNVELYPNALLVLQQLDALGKNIALITSSSHTNVSMQLEKYDLMQHFQVIIAGDDVVHHKPHPEPLEKALAALGGEKSRAIMIGDSDKDIGAAVNFGCDSILFYPPEHTKYYELETLQKLKPTYTISDFHDVLDIIK